MTTNEFIEIEQGFTCEACETFNSTKFKFNCTYDESEVCLSCLEKCSKCGQLFSKLNTKVCGVSNKKYCLNHIANCEICNKIVGVNQLRTCDALGKKICNCTEFKKCALCESEYSSISLVDDKCTFQPRNNQ